MSRQSNYNIRRAKVDPAFKARRAQLHTEHRRRLRAKVIKAHGGECACCGIFTIEFLALHHKLGGGNIERKAVSQASIYYRLVKKPDRRRYGVLCHNCNFAKGAYGYCPHQAR